MLDKFKARDKAAGGPSHSNRSDSIIAIELNGARVGCHDRSNPVI